MSDDLQNKINFSLTQDKRKYKFSKQRIFEIGMHLYNDLSKYKISNYEIELLEKIFPQQHHTNTTTKEKIADLEMIREVHHTIFQKVLEFLTNINSIKSIRKFVRKKYFLRRIKLFKKLKKKNSLKNDHIFDSKFNFSDRFKKIANNLNIITYKDLLEIPINDFVKYRGFRGRCAHELIEFIEFENIEEKFNGFIAFKKKYYRIKK